MSQLYNGRLIRESVKITSREINISIKRNRQRRATRPLQFNLLYFLVLYHGTQNWTDFYLITHAYKHVQLPKRIEWKKECRYDGRFCDLLPLKSWFYEVKPWFPVDRWDQIAGLS